MASERPRLTHDPSPAYFAAPMPTYDYKCDACGKGFSKEQRITEDPIKKCPKCGKLKARRMISGGEFILKGGGWYSDLYSSADPKKKKDKPESKSEKSESKSEPKSDAKPKKKAAKAD